MPAAAGVRPSGARRRGLLRRAVVGLLLLVPLPAAASSRFGEPPEVVLRTSGGAWKGTFLHACWPEKAPARGPRLTVCEDTVPGPYPGPYVRTYPGETVAFQIRWSQRPTSVVLEVYEDYTDDGPPPRRLDRIRLVPSLSSRWPVPDRAGRYHLVIGANWRSDPRTGKPASVSWAFKLEVAESGGGVLPRTGVSTSTDIGWLLLAIGALIGLLTRRVPGT